MTSPTEIAAVPETPPSIASHLSIAAVERDAGLSKDVLRVWERRYGFPLPARDPNGERLYPLPQVERLRTIKRLMDAGHRPGKLLALSESDLDTLANRQTRPRRGDESGDLQRQILDLVHEHDTSGLRQLLSLSLMKQGLQEFVIETVAPLNRAVTEAWMRGEVEVFEERAYTEQVQMVLRAAMLPTSGGANSMQPPRIVLATLPNEVNALGLCRWGLRCRFQKLQRLRWRLRRTWWRCRSRRRLVRNRRWRALNHCARWSRPRLRSGLAES